MLFKTLDALRQKPKPVRDQYALLFAVACTLVIGGVWSLSLPSRLSTTNLATVSAASTTVPFGGMWAEFRSKFSWAATPTAPVVGTTTEPVTDAPDDALDLELRQENITTVNASSAAAIPPPVTILIGTTSTASSTD
jgi:hypothetical protein